MNTVALLRAASAALGMSPVRTMSAAEQLYMSGVISYPRTESTRYPRSLDINSLVRPLTTSTRDWGKVATRILENSSIRVPNRGVDKGDHPPITPLRAYSGPPGSDGAKIFQIVVCHFLGSLLPNLEYEEHVVTVAVGSWQKGRKDKEKETKANRKS